MEKKYGIGLDIGIGSVGWAVVKLDDDNNAEKIIDLGVRTFDSGEVAKTGESKNKIRRDSRGVRRLIRRKRHRLERIRQLLDEHNIINIDFKGDNFSDYANYSKKFTDNIINEYYRKNKTNPFLLKVKALDKPLTNEEILIITLHYAKYRGYKSNREDKNESKTSETGRVLSAIKENEEILKNYRTVSEMLVKDSKFKKRIHNEPGDYKTSISREKIEEEINIILDKQIEFGTISPKFKEEYIEIWGTQRSYAKGPGKGSIYGVPEGEELIDKMIGTCKFTGEKRAPKNAPSVEKFIALQNLANFRYSTDESLNYKSLTTEEKLLIINVLEQQNSITYKKIASIIGVGKMNVKGNKASKNDFKKIINEMKKLLNKDKIQTKDFTEDERKLFNKIRHNLLLNKTFLKMPTYSYFRKEITKQFGKEEWEQLKDNYEFMDEVIRLLTIYKTEEILQKQLETSVLIDKKYYDFINNMPNYKEHIRLSLSLIKNLNPLLLEGMRYDEAMIKLGHNPYDVTTNKEKRNFLPGIIIDNNITNQRVIRSLSQSRKIINAIIKEHGTPTMINVEVARELAKTKEERNKIDSLNKDRKEDNIKDKKFLVSNFNNYFKKVEDVKSYDLLKYRLWVEQDEHCPYTSNKITVDELFANNIVQVDHILPYSRTGNDNYVNKTLVKTSANQDKGNRTPYEWLKGTDKLDKYETFIKNATKIHPDKKANYLLQNLTPEMENEFKARNLNDTKYISKYLASFIKAYLNVDEVNMIKGGITAKLRAVWGLNGLTHSIQSKTYYLPESDKNFDKKVRENHLHHALDAAIVAVTTQTLVKRVTEYEKYKRFFKNQKFAQIKNKSELKEEIINFEKETGEVYNEQELEDFLNDAIQKHYLKTNKDLNRLNYPVPYKYFTKELKLRLFERDLNTLHNEILQLPNYTTTNDVNLVIPTIAKSKINGPLHKETYYGLKEIDEELYLTSRVSINSKNFKEDTIQKIVNIDNSSKEVMKTLKKWIRGYKTGEEAFKAQGYPVNSKSGNMIKKVKIKKSTFKNKGHIIGHKKVVEISNIHKIGVYKRENSDNLFFVGYDLLTIQKIKNEKTDNLNINVWWGQGQNNETLSYNEFTQKYKNYVELFKDDLIMVELKNGNKGLAYVVGFSSGLFEVKDILGDGFDLTNKKITNNLGRTQLTISTLKSIKKVGISLLGKIEKQYQIL